MNCPICERPSQPSHKPFCSKRCADVDLAKWLNGSYAIASTDPDDAETLIEAMEQALNEPKNKPEEKLH